MLVLMIVAVGVLLLLGGFAWASRGRPASEAKGSDSSTKFPFGGTGL